MNNGKSITEDEMILEFISAERVSERREQYERFDLASLIGRRQAIQAVRGFPNLLLFSGFPPNTTIQWTRYTCAPCDLDRLYYIGNDEYWAALSSGSRRVSDGAMNPGRRTKISEIAANLEPKSSFPALIAVQVNERIVLIEGHHRATAYALKNMPTNFDLIIGISIDNFSSWHFR